MSALQELLPELNEIGYQLIAISTDSPTGLDKAIQERSLTYTLLSDADLNAAKQFGIAYKAPKQYWDMLPKTTGGWDKDLLLPVPSIFIVDRMGKIHYEYINPDFKQRINPGLLKAIAKEVYPEL